MAATPENCRINYVELNVRDIDKAKAFYGKAFGWTFTDYGPQYTEFSDGAMKGGFTTQAPPSPAGGPLVVLYADKLEAARDSVLAAGGKIKLDIFAFPAGGAFISTTQTGMSWRSGRRTRRAQQRHCGWLLRRRSRKPGCCYMANFEAAFHRAIRVMWYCR
jgi:predicted enzyme related to lactoylglutathione lyase